MTGSSENDAEANVPATGYISIPTRNAAGFGAGGTLGEGNGDGSDEVPGFITRRQSIFDQPFGSFRGVNSLSRFATSLRRAHSFRQIEVKPDVERSFFDETNDELYDPNTLAPAQNGRKLSVTLNRIGNISMRPSITNLESDSRVSSIVNTVYDGYGSIRGNLSQQPLLHPQPSMAESLNLMGPDTDTVMVKKLEGKHGTVVTVLAGQSTAPQTIFNSINVLIGLGLLALPLGLRHAGWIIGLSMLFTFAFGTFCSAELLSRCLDTDPTLMSYADLGYAAFGAKGRALISCLFSIDLLACGVSLIVLFGDSLNALFPQYSATAFKILGFLVVTPFVFIPLSILSNISLLGIISTIGTVFIITICGFYKRESPGSLVEAMPTQLWPTNFKSFCLSIGLLSACWGGHAIFPNLKRDMRHPEKFKDCLKTTYKATSVTDIGIAVIGYLMFGSLVTGEITTNIMLTDGYPGAIYALLSALMTIIPIAKTPLNARPIISILDILLNIEGKEIIWRGNIFNKTNILLFCNRIAVNAAFVIIAIIFPKFDKLIAFLGAGVCFAICLILPCLFYIKLCHDTIKQWERTACWITICISVVLATLGIGAAFAS